MLIVPLSAVASQVFDVTLGSQDCRIQVYQKSANLYLDLYVSNAALMKGVICRDRLLLVRQDYLGFTGDLAFFDIQGTSDPVYPGLSSRFMLAYMETGDLS